jgi:hypothetical protein
MPAVYFFLIDVSMNALHTGATAAACSAISQALSDLPVSLHDILFALVTTDYMTLIHINSITFIP